MVAKLFAVQITWLLRRFSRRAAFYESEEGIAVGNHLSCLESPRFTLWARMALALSVITPFLYWIHSRLFLPSILVFLICLVLSDAVLCDLVARIIPKECCIGLAVLGVAYQLLCNDVYSLLAGVCCALLAGIIMVVTPRLFCQDKTAAVGGGDIKLIAALSIVCGKLSAFALLVGVGSAALFALGSLCLKRLSRKDTFAFAPFIAAGISVLVL